MREIGLSLNDCRWCWEGFLCVRKSPHRDMRLPELKRSSLKMSLNTWPWSNDILKTCTQHGPSKIQSYQTIVLCVLECHNIAFKGDAIAIDTAPEAWFSGNMGRRSPCHSNSKNPVTRETKIFINVWFIITPCGARATAARVPEIERPLLNTKKSSLLRRQNDSNSDITNAKNTRFYSLYLKGLAWFKV